MRRWMRRAIWTLAVMAGLTVVIGVAVMAGAGVGMVLAAM